MHMNGTERKPERNIVRPNERATMNNKLEGIQSASARREIMHVLIYQSQNSYILLFSIHFNIYFHFVLE